MKILITGGAGFIGSNFIHHTLSIRPDWKILNLDALTYAGNMENFKDLPSELKERHKFIQGDIRDAAFLEKLFNTEEIDRVVHFAAESHVDRSILGPDAFVETNVVGTFRLLEAAKKTGKEKTRTIHSVSCMSPPMRYMAAWVLRVISQRIHPMTLPAPTPPQRHHQINL